MSSVEQELKVRRLKWLRDIMAYPEENVQLRAALGGRMDIGDRRIGGEYVPWLNQVIEDLRWYMTATEALGRPSDEDRCRGTPPTAIGMGTNRLQMENHGWGKDAMVPDDDDLPRGP